MLGEIFVCVMKSNDLAGFREESELLRAFSKRCQQSGRETWTLQICFHLVRSCLRPSFRSAIWNYLLSGCLM